MRTHTLATLAQVGATLACAALVMSCGGGGGAIAPPPTAASLSVYAGSLQSAGSHDGVGIAAQFNGPVYVAQDTAGNVYVADAGNNTIRKTSLDGTVTTIAGTAGQSGSADGAGPLARFSGPSGVAVDAAGNLYVSDRGNGTLRKVSVQGVVTTIAGVAGQSASIDGDAASARLNKPGSLAIDGAGNIYVVADNALRKRAPDGSITTFAGQAGFIGSPVVGNAAASRFGQLSSVAVDNAGNVYVADQVHFGLLGDTGTIRKFDSYGQALPFGASADGVLQVQFPRDISLDASGNLYVASGGGAPSGLRGSTTYTFVSRITPDGMSNTILTGITDDARTVDGPLASARFDGPFAIAAGPNGRIVVGELATIRLIDTQQGVVSTLAGGLGDGEMDGAGAVARFNQPVGLATGPDGTLFVADKGNSSVRQISTTGVVSTFRRDSKRPFNLAIGPNGGTMYALSSVIDRILMNPIVYAVTQDGPAWLSDLTSTVTSTASIAVDAAGNLYAANESLNNPGSLGVLAYAPDGTKRVLATDTRSVALAVDGAGNVYFTSYRATVGVISPTAGVTILAGRPDDRGDDDGAGQAARFRYPGALALDPAGNVYVADGTKIRRVTPQGAVTTIADVSNVQGAQPGFALDPHELAIRGLAWSDGALYATVVNAVVKITF
jgi:sugar lactone lactonase YvrE